MTRGCEVLMLVRSRLHPLKAVSSVMAMILARIE
ncbi:hypothetical protein EPYR_02299 [Erwinia pyrifoliae DSM 12163]|nr:hypothetical protein EPYR_02299 [Erwinia pyrifoliae DSM 12163]